MLPAKSVAQCPRVWGPSLNLVVSITVEPETAVRQGCIRVPRHSPETITFWQLYSARPTLPPSIEVSPKRTPLPPSFPQKPTLREPRCQPPAVRSPPIPAPGAPLSSIVIVSARTADHDPGSRLHHFDSARAQSSRSSIAGAAGENPAAKLRGVASVSVATANGEKPAGDIVPIRCSIPSWRACHQVPVIRVIPVPGGASQRQRAKRVPDTVPEVAVKLFTCTPENGSAPGATAQNASGRNLPAPAVSAQPASIATYQPHWATEYLPASASRATSRSRASASATPSPTILTTPLRAPDI